MQSENQRQRDYWNSLSEMNPDAAVIDPNDHRGCKNRYLAWLRDRAFANSLADIATSAVLLDFGCGTGSSTRNLLAAGYRVVGLDLAHELLRRAQDRFGGSNVLFVAYDGTTPPLMPGCFDASTSYVVLSYVVDDDAAQNLLAEIRKTMRPRARIALIEQARRHRRIVEGGLKIHRSPEEWCAILIGAGFRHVRSRILRHGRFPTTPVIRLGLVPPMFWPIVAAIEERVAAMTGVFPWDYAEILIEADA